MRVEMKIHITGSRNGQLWPDIGGIIDLPEQEAAELIANGYAEEVTDAPSTARSDAPSSAGPTEAPTGGSGETPDLGSLDKDALIALAEEQGVEIDKRWGERRIRKAIREA